MNRVLFGAESVYQLFNVLILRQTYYKEWSADLILSNITPWDEKQIEGIKRTELFNSVMSPLSHEMEAEFWDMEIEAQRNIIENPRYLLEQYFDNYSFSHDEIAVPIDHLLWKLVFLCELDLNCEVKLSIYEEGNRAYTMDLSRTDEKVYFSNGKRKVFFKSIDKYFLYQPDLYSVGNNNFNIKKINIDVNDIQLINNVSLVFGKQIIPKEKFIYLEDHFTADKLATNDFELFELVANTVGRDNIIVKCHPRDWNNRFRDKGYKCIQESVVPWEVLLLLNEFENKVFISVMSTSLYSAFSLFDSSMHVISLENMFIGNPSMKNDVGYQRFKKSLMYKVNSKGVHIHSPSSYQELQEVVRYINIMTCEEK